MAVATWQKSTARRLVSIFAVRDITNQMVCGPCPAVTSTRQPGGLGLDDRPHRREHVGLAGQAHGPPDDAAVRAEHEHGGSAADAQPPRQVQPRGRVDLDVPYAVYHPRHLGQQLARGPARRAEGGRELHQRGPLTQLAAEVGFGQGERSRPRRARPGVPRRGLTRPGSARRGAAAPRRSGWPRPAPRPARSARQSRPYSARTRRHPFPPGIPCPAAGAADQVGVTVRSSLLPAVISNLPIGLAVFGIEPLYQTLPSSWAVVQEATRERVPSG